MLNCTLCQHPVLKGVKGAGCIVCQDCIDTGRLPIDPKAPTQWMPYEYSENGDAKEAVPR